MSRSPSRASTAVPRWTESRTFVPLVLSATTLEALRLRASTLAGHLRDEPYVDLSAVALALSLREPARHRIVVDGCDRDTALAALDAFASGNDSAVAACGVARGTGRTAFVFPGQGSQWRRMALDLVGDSPVYAAMLSACDAALAPYVEWSLFDVLTGDGAVLDEVDVVQPTLWAVMVSLGALWLAHGVEPDVVLGHSQGEVAAACIAGALSLDDGARIVASRSLVLRSLIGQVGLLAVGAGVDDVRAVLAERGAAASIASVNGAEAVVLAGTPDELDELCLVFKAAGWRSSRVASNVASHCAPVDELRAPLLAALDGVDPRPARFRMFSTVTAAEVDADALGAEYWFRNLREPVQLHAVTSQLLDDGVDVLLEVSPRPVLITALEGTVAQRADGGLAPAVVSTLRRGSGDGARFGAALAQAWVAGTNVDWGAWHAGSGVEPAELPTFAFERRAA